MKAIRDEVVKVVVEMYKAGATYKEILESTGVSCRSISTLVNKYGSGTRGLSKSNSKQLDDAAVIEMYTSGTPMVAIATLAGVSHDTIRRHLKKAGIDTSKKSKPTTLQ